MTIKSSVLIAAALLSLNAFAQSKGRAEPVAAVDVCALLREKGANPQATITARPLPYDSRLVVFPYSHNALYPVYTAFNRQTHFEFEPGEKIKGSYVFDETEFEQKVSITEQDIFIRPRVRGATGSMTVITNKRRYQIELLDVSNCPLESRYQRVSWQISEGAYEARAERLPQESGQGADFVSVGANNAAPSGSATGVRPPQRENPDLVDLSRLNLEYAIEGASDIRPSRVFDDGQRTWIQYSRTIKLRPALFAINTEGQGEPVEYVPKEDAFFVNRVFTHGALLKLGTQEVRILNKSKRCGLFDAACKQVTPKNID